MFHTGEMKTFWLHKPCEVDVELAMELQEQDSSTDSDGEGTALVIIVIHKTLLQSNFQLL